MQAVPSTTWRMLAGRTANKELPKGLDAAWDAAAGLTKRFMTRTQSFLERADRVLAMEGEFSGVADAKLRQMAVDFREVFLCGRETPEDIDRAFALVREVAFRQLGEKPFKVQIAGAMAIEAGGIAEMATGEGKTLTATMPATIAGLRGKGCHVITFNDYLAKRDAEWMAKIYKFCGLSTAHIEGQMPPEQRRQAYLADITYCTNKEVTADFLRDRLSLGRCSGLPGALLAKIAEGSGSGTDRLVQRGLHCAIVDEADSILIDEAVTPLIISGNAPNAEQVEAFQHAADFAAQLDQQSHYKLNERYREVDMTPAGKQALAQLARELGGVWAGGRRREELVTQALTARHYYAVGKQYVVEDGKVVIVDEFTGRLMPDREWRDGLHQAVSAKEKVEVQPPKDTFARVSFQRFFRLYKKLSGMTGTAIEGRREFWQIYHLPTVVVPPNRPCIRTKAADRVFATSQAKWDAILDRIRHLNSTGRPVLVGTRSVRASEHLSAMLSEQSMEHVVLNAVKHAEEAQIVAGAGQRGRITVATNMAGRGTNIKLGRGVEELGGLAVIATERHEAGRIDRQLYGRSGRQGEPGSAETFVCMEDELIRRHAPLLGNAMTKRGNGSGETSSTITRGIFDFAQRRAERLALRQRKSVLSTDDWLDEYLGFAGSER